MKKWFAVQKCVCIVYILTTLAVLVYALAFMTQYSDLTGLKLPQNQRIANFYLNGLQTFNQAIFAWALLAVAGIALLFFLELYTRVPDRFALIVMAVCLSLCCYGAIFGIGNLLSLAAYYASLDFSGLVLEGGPALYELKFTTFRVGIGIYSAQMAVCVLFMTILIISHVKYRKLEKKEAEKNG